MIDLDKLYELRKAIHFNDNVYHSEKLLVEKICNWDDFRDCTVQNNTFDCSILNKTDSIYDPVSTLEVRTKDNTEEKQIYHPTGNINGTPSWDARDYFENGHMVVIKNFERKNENVNNLIKQLMQVFYLNIEDHGIWPAIVNQYSGHAHLYGGLENSNSFAPHADPYCNFIFQIEGITEITIYKNRVCSLMDHQLQISATQEQRKENIDNFEIQELITMNEGDCLYIPNRQFNYFKSKTNRLSLSIPLIMKGPMAC